MKIYTGFGDAGQTHLFGGQIVLKDDLRVESYGTADELNSFIGLLIAELKEEKRIEFLRKIQQTIFRLSSELATPADVKKKSVKQAVRKEDIRELENEIDKMEANLTPLKNFILPGGVRAAALTHVSRTICRRLERRLTTLNTNNPLDANIIVFINRLADFLFVLARILNCNEQVGDIIWKSDR